MTCAHVTTTPRWSIQKPDPRIVNGCSREGRGRSCSCITATATVAFLIRSSAALGAATIWVEFRRLTSPGRNGLQEGPYVRTVQGLSDREIPGMTLFLNLRGRHELTCNVSE